MNDADLARRLARLRPADLPAPLQQRLLAAEPTSPLLTGRNHWVRIWQQWLEPWSLAYTGLLAIWVVIFTLHRLTIPLLPPTPSPGAFVQVGPSGLGDIRVSLLSSLSLDRTTLLTRNEVPQP